MPVLLPLTPGVAEELQAGTIVLRDGVRMPRLGFGTAGASVASLLMALQHGVRMLDTAIMYRNEHTVAQALEKSGLPRGEFFLISKAWPYGPLKGRSRPFNTTGAKSKETVIADVQAHLKALRCGYLDLLLIHWPTSSLVQHWEALLELRSQRLTRSVGLSNADEPHLAMLDAFPVAQRPVLVQTDVGALKFDDRISINVHALARTCWHRHVTLMSHSPLRAALKDARAISLAREHNRSVASMVLRYGLQRNFALLFSSTKDAHVRDSLGALNATNLDLQTVQNISGWRGDALPEVHLGHGSELMPVAVFDTCPTRCVTCRRGVSASVPFDMQIEVDPVTRWGSPATKPAVEQACSEPWVCEMEAATPLSVLSTGQQHTSVRLALNRLRQNREHFLQTLPKGWSSFDLDVSKVRLSLSISLGSETHTMCMMHSWTHSLL